MPHLTIEYSKNLEQKLDVQELCDALLEESLKQLDDKGNRIFPVGGTRVFAYPAAYYAIADGQDTHGFIYVKARITAGRPPQLVKQIGDNLLTVLRQFISPLYVSETIGYTLQLDEGAEVYDAKEGNLRSLFS